MVDAVVSLAIERIADLLIQEAKFLTSVRPEVIRLQDELKRMHCFLKDADGRQHQDERVRNWISEIRRLAYDSEDIIETFILKFAASRGACSFVNVFTKAHNLHRIGNQIQTIRTGIEDISKSMQTYGIKFEAERDGDMQQRSRRSYPHVEEEHFIGFDAITADLKSQLMMEEERVRVISIVGMGGLGKTTLAKKTYNDIHVKKHFDCQSWAFISQQFFHRDVLIGILKNVVSSGNKAKQWEKMQENELVEELYDDLKGKRYLVVLDDIWSIEAWDSLKNAFPNGKNGSKVLVTTRIKDVASYADPWSTPIEPPLLNENEGWELLSKKAFPKNVLIEHHNTPEFEELGKEMVKRCGGLPLAVAVIGGLLATKKSVKEWKVVQKNINAQFAKLERTHHQYRGVYGILALSYHDLPFHLKPCFLYFSQFPEDWQIKKKELIRMWIAEGFISQSTQGEGDETIEDRAEEYYLKELVNRGMIQVSQWDHTGIGVKICCMHDLVRDMCISKAKEEHFLQVFGQSEYAAVAETSLSTMTDQSRRMAIHSRESKDYINKHLSRRGNFRFRSLLYFVEQETCEMTKQQGMSLFKNFRLLRVLNIENVLQVRGCFPKEIGDLIHLRYLGLRTTGVYNFLASVRSLMSNQHHYCRAILPASIRNLTSNLHHYCRPFLPASIRNLRSLYTLDLRDNWDIRLPYEVCKLESLRHLLLAQDTKGLVRFDSLRNLETLKVVRGKYLMRNDAVMQMANLRSLGIAFKTTEEIEEVLKSPSFVLGRLRSLKMTNLIAFPNLKAFPNLEALSRCQDLTKLDLAGPLKQSLEFLPANLTKLKLCRSHLEQDPMVVLEKLQNLRFLSLEVWAYGGLKMVCSTNGFPKLETLLLEGLLEVEEWRIEEGAMPCLKTLRLQSLDKLKTIPEGLKYVSTLQELKFWEMRAFKNKVRSINGVEGEDFYKVKHIPSILFEPSWDEDDAAPVE